MFEHKTEVFAVSGMDSVSMSQEVKNVTAIGKTAGRSIRFEQNFFEDMEKTYSGCSTARTAELRSLARESMHVNILSSGEPVMQALNFGDAFTILAAVISQKKITSDEMVLLYYPQDGIRHKMLLHCTEKELIFRKGKAWKGAICEQGMYVMCEASRSAAPSSVQEFASAVNA